MREHIGNVFIIIHELSSKKERTKEQAIKDLAKSADDTDNRRMIGEVEGIFDMPKRIM